MGGGRWAVDGWGSREWGIAIVYSRYRVNHLKSPLTLLLYVQYSLQPQFRFQIELRIETLLLNVDTSVSAYSKIDCRVNQLQMRFNAAQLGY